MVEHRIPTQIRESTGHAALIDRHCTPPLGQQLRLAVDQALADLPATPDPAAARRIDDLLVAGLAWAAATGDTCRIRPATQAVRAARACLAAHDPAGARTALLDARAGLTHPAPNQPDHARQPHPGTDARVPTGPSRTWV